MHSHPPALVCCAATPASRAIGKTSDHGTVTSTIRRRLRAILSALAAVLPDQSAHHQRPYLS